MRQPVAVVNRSQQTSLYGGGGGWAPVRRSDRQGHQGRHERCAATGPAATVRQREIPAPHGWSVKSAAS